MAKLFSEWILIIASIAVLGLFLWTVEGRLFYPYDLEWMEGGMLIHAQRVHQGLGLYVPPSSEFIPFIYPPLYAELLAVLADFWTLDYWLGRGVSIIATLATFLASIKLLRLEGLSWGLAFLGGALFLEGYDDCGTFYDLTRADSAMLACVAWSTLTLRMGKLPMSGILLCIAFLFKHNAAIFGVPFALWLWNTADWKQALKFGLWAAIPAVLCVCWLEWRTDGYFLTYLLQVPSHHPMVGDRLLWLSEYEMWNANAILITVMWGGYAWHLWNKGHRKSSVLLVLSLLMALGMTQVDENAYPDILGIRGAQRIPFAIGLWAFLGMAFLRRNWFNQLSASHQFWWLSAFTAIVFSAIMRGHHGGYTNVLMPGIWMLSLVTVLWISAQNWPKWVGLALGMLQLWWGAWEPAKYMPSDADKEAGDQLVELLQKQEGPIWIPHAPWLAVQAGHKPYTHLISLWDIDHSEGPLVAYVDTIQQDIQEHHFKNIVSANTRLRFGVNEYYNSTRTIRPSQKLFLPKTGWPVRPSYLYTPKK